MLRQAEYMSRNVMFFYRFAHEVEEVSAEIEEVGRELDKLGIWIVSAEEEERGEAG